MIWKYLNCSFDYFYSQTETFRICTGSSTLIPLVNQTYISCATFYGCAATGLPQDTTPSCHLLLLELVAASMNTTYWEALQLLPVLIVCTPFACHKKSNTHPSTAQGKYRYIREKRSRRPLIISQLEVTAAGAKHSLHPIIIHVHPLFYQISAQYQISPAGQGMRANLLPVLSQGWCNPVFYRMSVSWIPSRWHQHLRINSQRSLQWKYVQP